MKKPCTQIERMQKITYCQYHSFLRTPYALRTATYCLRVFYQPQACLEPVHTSSYRLGPLEAWERLPHRAVAAVSKTIHFSDLSQNLVLNEWQVLGKVCNLFFISEFMYTKPLKNK